jgi:hypothetical protein
MQLYKLCRLDHDKRREELRMIPLERGLMMEYFRCDVERLAGLLRRDPGAWLR